jgi:hypothetical protein
VLGEEEIPPPGGSFSFCKCCSVKNENGIAYSKGVANEDVYIFK